MLAKQESLQLLDMYIIAYWTSLKYEVYDYDLLG